MERDQFTSRENSVLFLDRCFFFLLSGNQREKHIGKNIAFILQLLIFCTCTKIPSKWLQLRFPVSTQLPLLLNAMNKLVTDAHSGGALLVKMNKSFWEWVEPVVLNGI